MIGTVISALSYITFFTVMLCLLFLNNFISTAAFAAVLIATVSTFNFLPYILYKFKIFPYKYWKLINAMFEHDWYL